MLKFKNLPDFLVIGAAKAGTTWIYNMLKSHPDIFIPSENQIGGNNEICFFSHNYDRGIDFYKSYFKEMKNESHIGDVTPSYLYHHGIPIANRIKTHLPNVKLIVCLRDPIYRAWSRYQDSLRKGYLPPWCSFFEAIKRKHYYETYIEYGFYFNHLKEYLECFNRDQIKIVFFEEMKETPRTFLKEIYSFLDVDKDYLPSSLLTTYNKKKYSYLKNFLQYIQAPEKKHLNILRIEKSKYLAKIIFKMCGGLKKVLIPSTKYPQMPLDVYSYLSDIYKESNNELLKLVNKDITW